MWSPPTGTVPHDFFRDANKTGESSILIRDNYEEKQISQFNREHANVRSSIEVQKTINSDKTSIGIVCGMF